MIIVRYGFAALSRALRTYTTLMKTCGIRNQSREDVRRNPQSVLLFLPDLPFSIERVRKAALIQLSDKARVEEVLGFCGLSLELGC
jgi:hypothetical protein